MTNAKYKKLTAGLLAAWFIFSLSASALSVFRSQSTGLPLAIGLAALTPVVAFLVWFAASDAFRQFALSLNPRTLTLAHTWRINGWIFVAL